MDEVKCAVCGSKAHLSAKCWLKPAFWALAAVVILMALALAWSLSR